MNLLKLSGSLINNQTYIGSMEEAYRLENIESFRPWKTGSVSLDKEAENRKHEVYATIDIIENPKNLPSKIKGKEFLKDVCKIEAGKWIKTKNNFSRILTETLQEMLHET